MKTTILTIATVLFFSIINSADAYLGGFEDPDGYRPFLNDVTVYNAGQYGANAGGGASFSIAPNSGLWAKLQGPLVPATGLAGGVAYATGHQNLDRTNPSTSDQALVITTNADGWTMGPQEYSYQLDSYDLNGVIPTSTGGQTIDFSFWSCASIVGSSTGNGLGPGTIGNTVSFYDSSGNLGFQVGYRQPGTTTDYAATNVGSWVQSAVAVSPTTYHRWDVSLDLGLQQVSIDVVESSVTTTLVSNAPLINPMNNFTEMRFVSTPGVTNSKIWALDDFSFRVEPIPEPASLSLLGVGLMGVVASSRRVGRQRVG